MQTMFVVIMALAFELNVFFLKYALWIPPTNPLNTYRWVTSIGQTPEDGLILIVQCTDIASTGKGCLNCAQQQKTKIPGLAG